MDCDSPHLVIDPNEKEEIAILFPIMANAKYYSGSIVKAFDPLTYEDKQYLYYDLFINNAEVFLNGHPMVNIDTIDQEHNYFMDPLNLNPGDTIRLTILLPGEQDTIKGYSVIPQPISDYQFSWDENYYYLKWQKSGNYCYSYFIYELAGWEHSSRFIGKSYQLSIDRPSLIQDMRRDSCFIAVFTYGENFTRYRIDGEDRVGISKHFGVFSGGIINLFLLDLQRNKIKKIY